jgi:ATP-dependent Clp protease protease subunit
MKKLFAALVIFALLCGGSSYWAWASEEKPATRELIIIVKPPPDKEGPKLSSNAYIMPDKMIVWKLSSVGYGDHSDLIDIFKVMDIKGSKKIQIILNNPGGAVFEGMAIAGLLQEKAKSGVEVEVRVYGLAASAATMVLVAGTPGKRFIEANALVMVHELMNFEFLSMKNVSEREKQAQIMRMIQENINRFVVAHTKVSAAELHKMVKDETWLNAQQAVKYGFADEVF